VSETTVRLRGHIDSISSPALERRLRHLIPCFRRILLDISKVDHIDSAGLGMLACAYMQARNARCNLEITNTPRSAKEVLRAWLHSVFEGHQEFLGLTPD
jgi:anti-anti-sigma factor